MNQVTLVGNLTDYVELRYTQRGPAVANFTMAVSRKERRNGAWQTVDRTLTRLPIRDTTSLVARAAQSPCRQ